VCPPNLVFGSQTTWDGVVIIYILCLGEWYECIQFFVWLKRLRKRDDSLVTCLVEQIKKERWTLVNLKHLSNFTWQILCFAES
jgi:hypothetical protein